EAEPRAGVSGSAAVAARARVAGHAGVRRAARAAASAARADTSAGRPWGRFIAAARGIEGARRPYAKTHSQLEGPHPVFGSMRRKCQGNYLKPHVLPGDRTPRSCVLSYR